jgi:undecaprenyl-diphosphatase
VWVALLAAGLLAGLIVEGNGFDGSLVRSLAGERTVSLTRVARALTNLGGPWLDVVFALAVVLLLALGRRRDAIFVLLAAGGTMLLTNAIKFILERPRPHGGLVAVSSYSWPSGHAASSIALYGALALVVARELPSAAARAAILIVCLILTGVIGATRVYLGVHYPSDVVAGWTVGGLWLLGVTRILPRPVESASAGAAPT